MQHTKKIFFIKRQSTIFFAKKNTATKQTACTYANRPEQQTQLPHNTTNKTNPAKYNRVQLPPKKNHPTTKQNAPQGINTLGEPPPHYKTKRTARNQYRLQKKTPRQNKRLALTQTAPNNKHSCVQLPLGKTHPTTKKAAPHEPRTACKKKHRDKTNGLHLRKPPRTKNTPSAF